jgi:rhodanese-related sulfurtransferase
MSKTRKKVFKFVLIFALVIGANYFYQQNSLQANQIDYSKVKLYKADINANQAYKMQQSAVVLIDVRTPKEYNELHPKGSINIPAFNDTFRGRVYNQEFPQRVYELMKKNQNSKIILICRTGSRTKVASNILAQSGFKNVYNVLGGVAYGWYAQKLPTQK